MDRRSFLLGCALPALAPAGNLVYSNNPNDVRNPYPEQQNPRSPRGKEIAEFARTLRIRRDIVFTHRPQQDLTLDIYTPGDVRGRVLPCVVAFGLSAFRLNETQYRWNLEQLPPAPTPNLYAPILARDRVVVVANLRTAPQAMWPAQIHDAKCAVRWVRKNAKEFGIDPQRIALFGASASASLGSLVALTAQSGELDDPAGDRDISTDVRGVCALSGIYDFEYYAKVDSGDRSLFVNVIPPYLGTTQKYYRAASAAHYIHAGAPPFFLTHGLQDNRVPFSQMPYFASLLKKVGVAVETETINHYQHGAIPGQMPDPSYDVTDRKIYSFFDRLS